MTKVYKALIDANVKLHVKVKEYDNGEIEIIDVEDIYDIEDFDNIKPLD